MTENREFFNSLTKPNRVQEYKGIIFLSHRRNPVNTTIIPKNVASPNTVGL